MMKRNILAVMIPALLVAGAANAAEVYNKDGNKLDVYGRAQGLHYFTKDTSADGDQSYVRFGFKGETQITKQLTGFGQWEYQIQANHTEAAGDSLQGTKTRLGFAGLKFGNYGSFDYGRNYGVVYDVEAWTDMLPEQGGDTYSYTDNFMNGRSNGLATYRNTDFFGMVKGLNFALQYQGKNDAAGESNNGRDLKRQNGDGFGLSSTYDIGYGVSIGAAYSASDRTNAQVSQAVALDGYAGGNKAEAWTTGIKYDANNVYLAAMYAETRNMTPFGSFPGASTYGIANKTQNFEVVAQYQFDFGLRPSIAYLQSKGKDLEVAGISRVYNNEDLVKYLDIGATYSFNKNMSTYVDYKINMLNDNDFAKTVGLGTDNIVALGLIYQF